MAIMARLYLLVLILAVPCAVWGETVPVLSADTDFSRHNLEGYLWYRADSTGEMTPQTAYTYFSQGEGKILEDEIPNLGNGDEAHWVGFSVRNGSSESLKFMLQIAFSMIDDVSYYVFERDSLITSVTGASYTVPNSERLVPHRVFAYPINTHPGTQYTVMMRLQKHDGILVLLINLFSEKDFLDYVELDNLMHGMAIGLLVLATLLGLFLFVLSRQVIYCFYALYILGILGFILSDQGYLSQYLAPRKMLFSSSGSWAFFIMLSVVAHTIFSLDFLQITFARYRKWVTVSWILNILASGVLLYLVLGFRLTDTMYNLTLLIGLVYVSMVFVFLVLGLRRKLVEAWLYLAAVGLFFFTIITKCLALFGFIADNWLIVNLLYYAPVIEVLVLLFGLAYNFRRNEKIKTAMAVDLARSREENALIATAVQESERKRIAKDLHDDLGNELAALQLQLSGEVPDFAKAIQIVSRASENLRNIAHDLMPAEFEQSSLSDLLNGAVARFESVGPTKWIFLKTGHEIETAKPRSLLIYRIATELMNNALKHAQAENVVVELAYRAGEVILIVQDDGIGFDPANTEPGEGLGFRSIRARVEQLQGRLEINSGSSGTTVIVAVPYRRASTDS